MRVQVAESNYKGRGNYLRLSAVEIFYKSKEEMKKIEEAEEKYHAEMGIEIRKPEYHELSREEQAKIMNKLRKKHGLCPLRYRA
jgi:hypothetical protein